MLVFEFFLLLLAPALLWLWRDNLAAREAALSALDAALRERGWQLLDESVVGHWRWPQRDEDGVLRLCRRFDGWYSDTGDNRRPASVLMCGDEVEDIYFALTVQCARHVDAAEVLTLPTGDGDEKTVTTEHGQGESR